MQRPSEVERFLLAHPQVRDVMLVETPGGPVAWVVPQGPLTSDELQQGLDERFGTNAPEAALLDALPSDGKGRLQLETLRRTPQASKRACARAEEQAAAAGVEAAALVSRRNNESFHPIDRLLSPELRPPLHAPRSAPAAVASAQSAQGEPSISQGPALRSSAERPALLTGVLARAALQAPDTSITFIDSQGQRQAVSYQRLWDDALRLLGGLSRVGLQPGDPLVLQISDPRTFITTFWACLLGKILVVPLPPSATFDRKNPAIERLLAISDRLEKPRVLADDACAEPLRMLGLRVDAVGELDLSEPGEKVDATPETPVLLSFTSGSTGTPKGVVLRHRNILTHDDGMEEGGWLSARDLGINWMPLDHVAGLANPHTVSVRQCAPHVMVSREYVLGDILRWLDLLTEFRATFSWAPNFAFALVNGRIEHGERRSWDLSSVRGLLCAGEPIVTETLKRFIQLMEPYGLRSDGVWPAWGMAETCSGMSMAKGVFNVGKTPFVSLGRAFGGATMRVVDDQDRPVPEEAVGHLQVRGDAVLEAYLNEEHTAASFTADRWFKTGDLAVMRDGHMAIAGRQKEVLIVNGQNIYPTDIEAVVERVPGVQPTFSVATATRLPHASTDSVIVFFAPAEGAQLDGVLRGIRDAVGKELGLGLDFLVPVAPEEIPRTGLGKKGRNELTRRFESGDFIDQRAAAEQIIGGPRALPTAIATPRWVRRDQADAPSTDDPVALVSAAGNLDAVERVLGGSGRRTLRYELSSLDAGKLINEGVKDVVLVPSQDGASHLSQTLSALHAFTRRGNQAPVRLFVALPEDLGADLPDPADASSLLVPGLLWSAAAEHPNLTIRLVWTGAAPDAIAQALRQELNGLRAAREVAYRNGERFERMYAESGPSAVSSPRWLTPRGLYVITGAPGGLARILAEYLRRTLQAKLLLLGRRPSDATVEELVNDLGETLYVAADVADHQAMHHAVARAETHFGGEVRAAFHLAGVAEPRPLLEESPTGLRARSNAHFGGALSLAAALKHRPSAKLVLGSSLMGVAGAAQHAAYCAAAGAVERLAEHLQARGREAVAVSLSAVRGTGMSKSLTALAPGFRWLDPTHAVAALVLATEAQEPALLAGMESTAPIWRTAGVGSGASLEEVSVFIPAGSGWRPEPGRAVGIERLPRTPQGQLDREALKALLTSSGGEPRDFAEKLVAQVFAEVIGADHVGRGSDFFALGGTSLHATRIVLRLEQRLGLRLREQVIFEHSSVLKLADELKRRVDASQVDVSRLSDEQVTGLLELLALKGQPSS